MPKLSDTAVPTYRRHKQSGQAIVTLSGRDILLGAYGTRQSRDKYNALIGEWLAAGRYLPAEPTAVTVAEIVNAYHKHAKLYYRRADGTPTGEASRIVRELSPLLKLYSRLPAAELSPLKVKPVREAMLAAGWVRTSINHAVGTIKRVVRWATENEMIPPATFHALQAVGGLKAGRSDAKESAPTRPVPVADVNAILPLVSAPIKAMIELQLLTGMRSGETTRGRRSTCRAISATRRSGSWATSTSRLPQRR